MPQAVGQFLRRRHQVEYLLWGRGAAWETLWAESPRTARRAKVGKAQLRIPVSEGEGEQDSVGGTWGTSDRERDKHGQSSCDTGQMSEEQKNRSLCPWVCSQLLPTTWFPVPPTPFIKAHTWWLGDDYHVAGQADVTGSSALEGDGGALEVVQHVHDGGEVQVLHSALAPLGQRQAQVLREERSMGSATGHGGSGTWGWGYSPPHRAPYLGYALEVECEHIFSTPCLTLPYQEHSVSVRTLQLNQLSCLHPGDGAVEPWVAGQEVIGFLTGWVQQPPRRSTW